MSILTNFKNIVLTSPLTLLMEPSRLNLVEITTTALSFLAISVSDFHTGGSLNDHLPAELWNIGVLLPRARSSFGNGPKSAVICAI